MQYPPVTTTCQDYLGLGRPLLLYPGFLAILRTAVAKVYRVDFCKDNHHRPSKPASLGHTRKKISEADSISGPVCPKCSSDFVKRVSRVGFERLISVLYIYPFRCEACRHRFRIMQWRVTYTRIKLDQAVARQRQQSSHQIKEGTLSLQ